jgi:hypothetical protein
VTASDTTLVLIYEPRLSKGPHFDVIVTIAGQVFGEDSFT